MLLIFVTVLSTLLFYLFLLSVFVSWAQKKKLREEFSTQMPSMFVTMMGHGIMVIGLDAVYLIFLLITSAPQMHLFIGVYDISIIIVQISTGYILYRKHEMRVGPVGRSIFDQYARPHWKLECEIN